MKANAAARSIRRRAALLLAAAALPAVALAAACSPGDPFRSTGAYPIDIFQEMHYDQSHKAQEPPRFLPPDGSYPVAGGFIPVDEIENIAEMSNPLEGDPSAMRRGALLFKQNCAACHGDLAGGDGYVGGVLADYNVNRPPAFGDAAGVSVIRDTGTTEISAGEAYRRLSAGFGFMPAFEGLLSEADRWALVALLDAAVAERQAELQAVNGVPEEERALELLRLRGQL